MNSSERIEDDLRKLGLSDDEVAIFVSLLRAPKNHLSLSRDTGIARSSVYRIIDNLIEKGIVHELTTDGNKILAAANPEALELLVVEKEAAATELRNTFDMLLPSLTAAQGPKEGFAIRTYEGASGARQMLWNELKSKSEILVFSGGRLEPATGRYWAEKFRAEIVSRGIRQRGLENVKLDIDAVSGVESYSNHYDYKYIPKSVLDITVEITVHDDFVSIYNARDSDIQLGTEIKNTLLASFMRQVFEGYWEKAEA